MILSDQTPKLPKWPFLAADAALLAAAWLIAENAAQPLRIHAIVAIVVCVICAGIAGAIPFLADYARRQDEALDNRQRSLETLARNSAAAAEQISIAAAGLNEIADAARKSLGQAVQLPGKLEERIAEFNALTVRSRADEKKAVEKEFAALRSAVAERLQATADKIALAAADGVRLAQSAGGAKNEPAPEISAPVNPPIAAAADPETPPEADPSAEVPQGGTKAEEPPASKPQPRKRSPKKVPPAAPSSTLPNLDIEETRSAKAELPSDLPAEARAEEGDVAPATSIAADGATRLLVTAYIGIGNRLFIRGKGPGLSWESGVPLQFVSIGKWRWDTDEAAEPIRFKLYKNDEIECSALGTGSLEPGHQQEVTATF